jgi:gamma-glutamyltranspeptidase/glutathione hydrolase
MGILMQDRGRYFSLDPAQPNALAPRKRPSHTLIPALLEKGDAHIGFGFVGGTTQALAQMQFISNIVDRGMSIQ